MARAANFAGMFQGASAFNRDLSRWNTAYGRDYDPRDSRVQNMFTNMFGAITIRGETVCPTISTCAVVGGRTVGAPVMANNNAFKCPRCA